MPVSLISIYDKESPEREIYERFLYDLLRGRKPWENISHKKMPSYEEHIEFVRSKPYKNWYIIDFKGPVGSVYITHKNEIGIFIERPFQGRKLGSAALNLLIAHNPDVETFYAHIGTYNSRSLAFFANKRFIFKEQELDKDGKLVQYTYMYANPYFRLPQPMRLPNC